MANGRFSNLKPPKYKIHPIGTKVKRISDGKRFVINQVQTASYKWGTEANYQLKLIGGKGGTLMVPEKNLRWAYNIVKK